MSKKIGQVSLEFILVFAVVLVVLTVFLLLSQEQVVDVNRAKQKTDAMNTVNDLSSAAKQVYAQGPGAKKQVMVKIPAGYNATNSYVDNRTIKLHVDGSDYLDVMNFDVDGTLPSTSGTYWVWVVSEGNRVTIGQLMLSIDRVTISLLMQINNTKNDSFSVTNVWGKAINVTLDANWIETNISLQTSPTSFELDPLESQTVNLIFQSDGKAVGYYTGTIVITGNDSELTEIATLPLTIEVPGYGVGIPPALRISPDILNESMQANQTVIRTFTACTNIYTTLTDINISPSLGDPGNWIGAPASTGPLDYDDCRSININLTVPAGTYGGTYTGYILFEGIGAEDAEDTVALSVNVGGAPDDTEGPVVNNVGKIPIRSIEDDTIVFYAVGDDSATGNSVIQGCEMNIDGGGWLSMEATDGAFDEAAENITYTYLGGLDFGVHVANIRCTDAKGNVGATEAYQFKVMRPILLVSTGSYFWSQWWWWIWFHDSFWGYNWEFDYATVDEVIAGVDTSMYTTVMVVKYSYGSAITPILSNYEASGGSVILVDESLRYGPRELGLTASDGSHTNADDVEIVNNNHSITEDYALGDLRIFPSKTKIYYITGFSGTQLALSEDGNNRTVLGHDDHYLIWGPRLSLFRVFNGNGDYLTTKVIDYAILNSDLQ